jgi:hypothetical protein
MVTNESKPMNESMKSETEQFGKGDIGILNYALTLEYLETAFYEEVTKSGLFKGEELAPAPSRISAPPPTSARRATSKALKCSPRRSRSTASRPDTRPP